MPSLLSPSYRGLTLAAIALVASCSRTEVRDLGTVSPIDGRNPDAAVADAGADGAPVDAGVLDASDAHTGADAASDAGGVDAAGTGGTAGGAGDAAAAGAGADGGPGGASGGDGGPGGASGSGGAGGTGASAGTDAGNGGASGACAADDECPDLGFCSLGVCSLGTCTSVDRDADQDGFVPTQCGGSDCNDQNPLASPGQTEVCADGADNDCNGVMDCRDPVCATAAACACVVAPGGEVCDNSIDDDCDAALDCNDPDCLGTPACGCAPAEASCGDGIDDDCDGALDCDDADCASTPQCTCSANPETCTDGEDQDCDLLVDCADPECATDGACLCPDTPGPEICDDFRDQDCDRLVDCADSECFNSPACAACSTEICDNGLDDDCDDTIDCADDACRFQPGCEPVAEECNDGFDDDRDGTIDCQDTDCAQNPYCLEQQSNCLTAKRISASGTYVGETFGNIPQNDGTCGGASGEAVFKLVLDQASSVSLDTRGSDFDTTLYVRVGSCSWGREIDCDDDTGGNWSSLVTFNLLQPGTYFVFVDGFTVDPDLGPDEGNFVLNVDLNWDPVEDCSNGRDDDGNVYADCADPACALVGFCATCNAGGPGAPELGPAACTDKADNDCDGLSDCADEDCSASDTMTTECCDGLDENGNRIPDDFNCRCASDADCGSQICYSGTVQACGIPCTWFVGDVCPFIAPGSTCNAATQECEF